MVSSFRREVAENYATLDNYAARSVIYEWRFGTTYRSHPQGSRIQKRNFPLDSGTLRMGTIICPETSVRNCRYWLRNNPEERSSQYQYVHNEVS